MSFFFRAKGHVTVNRPTALVLNSMNVLCPTLLLLAVALLVFAPSSETSPEVRKLLILYAAMLVTASLVIRIVWGLCIRAIRRRATKNEQ